MKLQYVIELVPTVHSTLKQSSMHHEQLMLRSSNADYPFSEPKINEDFLLHHCSPVDLDAGATLFSKLLLLQIRCLTNAGLAHQDPCSATCCGAAYWCQMTRD